MILMHPNEGLITMILRGVRERTATSRLAHAFGVISVRVPTFILGLIYMCVCVRAEKSSIPELLVALFPAA